MIHGGRPHDPLIASGLTCEPAALDWLLSFSDIERGVGWNPRAAPDEQWQLGRTRALLDGLGSPDRGLTTILIAGTKGKGSTAAFLARILAVAGIRAGLYTQPHLQSYRERIRVDGTAITPAELEREVGVIRDAVSRLRCGDPHAEEPTTFELTTAFALHHFEVSGCAVAILEVGMGGRLDATNAVSPAVSVITSISRDHLAILGPTLTDVAREKAGILRAGKPAFFAPQTKAVAVVLAEAGMSLGAPTTVVEPVGPDDNIALLGDHQRINAALAAAASRALPGIVVTEHAIATGLATATWPGRFEVVAGEPLFVLDGAHNDASAAALAQATRAFARGRSVTLIVGMHADKETDAVLGPLCALAVGAIATQVQSPRALPAAEVAAGCLAFGTPTEIAPSVGRAIARAREVADAGSIVLVSGSLAVVGEARDALGLAIVERLW